MPAFNSRKIPLELVDYILDAILSDYPSTSLSERKTLQSCSLVCKSWLPRSSAHLFRAIEIHARQLEEYLTLARTSTRLRTHVREFIIHGTTDTTIYLASIFATMPKLCLLEQRDNSTEQFAKPPDFVLGDEDSDRTASLHYVEPPPGVNAARGGSFDIGHLKFSSMPPVTLALSLRPFRRIDTLELGFIRERYRPHLGGLARPRRYGRLLPFTSPLEVRKLVVNGALAEILGRLLATIPLQPTTLYITEFSQPFEPRLSDFLRNAGCNIEKLVVWPMGPFQRPLGEAVYSHLRLEALTLAHSLPKLQTLEFRSSGIYAHSCGHLLWCFPCKTIRSIVITLHESSLWETLASVCSVLQEQSSDFVSVKTVEFVGLGGGALMSAEYLQELQEQAEERCAGNLRGKIRLSA